ncbi:Npun_R2821/Npun_R2822 family protein [Oscillatoria sp. FACHB-1406]|uniref:Npun_R2821/Npun_R2822 family protein n=1 Tax=Oscillatoria sp. FACHB-1406 TaxID=2692846 RepID=UPI0018EF940D|nr:Npun_R2821/Npun_R2822 family protein [Oscillatoria sp. FACHB-1406]
MNGIYTLANDIVYDQLVALLNSIEVNVGKDFPVRVIAYDRNLEKVRELIKDRKSVELIDDWELFHPWHDFSRKVWETHPSALQTWKEKGIDGVYRLSCNHRYFAFDERAPFDRFIYFDADVVVLNSLEFIFEQLDKSDFVIYDFQYKDPSHIFNVNSPKLFDVFPENKVRSEIFCSGFFASKKGVFPLEKRDWLVSKLQEGEAEVLYMNAPNQSVLNYMRMRSEIPIYNFSLHLPEAERTGCSVTSPHFEMRDNLLYDKGARLTYLHYIGLSSKLFSRLCEGENIDFPYRDIFLHYRYLKEPEKRPQFQGKAKPYDAPPSFADKVKKKLGLFK